MVRTKQILEQIIEHQKKHDALLEQQLQLEIAIGNLNKELYALVSSEKFYYNGFLFTIDTSSELPVYWVKIEPVETINAEGQL